MNDYFHRRRYAGATDRRMIREQVYDILRRRAKLDWWIARSELKLSSSPRLCLLADLTLMACFNLEQIMVLFSGEKYSPKPLDDHEKVLVSNLQGQPLRHPDMPRAIAFEYPVWMDQLLSGLWGSRFEEEMAALNQRAPVDLRVNTLKVTREKAQSLLSEASITSNPTPLSPFGLRVEEHKNLIGTMAFNKGFVEVQDEGSQLLACLVGARPGMTVVDFCAGAGGKTLALAAAMAEDGKLSGRLYACDVSANRMSRMHERIRRSGAFGIKFQKISDAEDNWTQANHRSADRVLLDVPCTATGRWRRDLVSKWRYQKFDLDNFRREQQAIMSIASSLVKPGGRLVYATCSVLQEENEGQVAWFLARNKMFNALCIEDVWSETIGGIPPQTGLALRLSPASSGTDGFFCAVMERSK